MSDTLQLFPSNETCCPPRGDVQELALIVMGEGVGLSTVRLQDRAPGFGDRQSTKPVFRTFPGPQWNDGQHLGYFDLTVHTGDDNRGAVGIDHLSNNVGGSKNVRIQAGRGGAAVVSAASLSVLFPRLVSARRLLVVGRDLTFGGTSAG